MTVESFSIEHTNEAQCPGDSETRNLSLSFLLFTDAGKTEWHGAFIMITDTMESRQVAFTMRSIQPTNGSSQVWDGLAALRSHNHTESVSVHFQTQIFLQSGSIFFLVSVNQKDSWIISYSHDCGSTTVRMKHPGFMATDFSTGILYSLIGINFYRCSDSTYVLLLTMNNTLKIFTDFYAYVCLASTSEFQAERTFSFAAL